VAFDINIFRVDSLIACIRTLSNPQVHNKTLLLLSTLAQIAPELILKHVMPIFTFMGANVLHQDDEYSAHVVERVFTFKDLANVDYKICDSDVGFVW
jgi:U3 small nucleolar RNA-associated protein 10